MNLTSPDLYLPEEGFRWYGPDDIVPLSYIRQAGATSVFTSLHQLPYGALWPREAIRERKAALEAAGLTWSVVESLPVHEDIKIGHGDLTGLFANYRESLRNLAAEGITTVMYNFMPLLDWVRTNMRHVLPDGSECLLFDPVRFAAFDIQACGRKTAEGRHEPQILQKADAWWNALDEAEQTSFVTSIIDALPGHKLDRSMPQFREVLSRFEDTTRDKLKENLVRFLEAVVPAAEEAGVRLAVHPDDPPFPVLGLPRIVSTADDLEFILESVDSPANGLCFCTGSLSARVDNDLVGAFRKFGSRVHAVHLRSTQRCEDGSFYESDHLAGSVDMPEIVRCLIEEQDQRRAAGRNDWRLPFRSDHGHTMMDDLEKADRIVPGYGCIGRMRGLAELRGLMLGIRHMTTKL